MKDLIKFCISRPVTVIMIMAAIILGGIVSLLSMPLDRLPEINLPQVTVETLYPGMSASDVRTSVTIPLEDAMAPVKRLDRIRSVSRDGVSLITLGFRWGTDPASAAALVREAVDRVYPGLPQGVRKPAVISGYMGEEAHSIVAVRSVSGDNGFARNLAEYELRARFRRLDGTGAVILSGGEIEETKIRLNPERLVSRGLNGDDMAALVASEIADIPAGNAREGNRELTVVSQGRPRSLEELSGLIIPSQTGPLKLEDLGKTTKEFAPQKSIFIFQDQEQTALEIYRRPGSDPIKLSRDIKKVLARSKEDFGRDLELNLVWDSSSSILRSVKNLIISAVLAAAAVALILALFIKHFQYSLFAALALPVSGAASLILLKLTGRSLNSMSLGGIAMGIGLVSDASVIILDVLSRPLDLKEQSFHAEMGRRAASVSGSSLAGTITTVVVFLPIVFLPGPLGALFGDLSLALVASVIMGWVYAQFCIPALFLFFLKEGKILQLPKKTGSKRYYRRLLKYSLRRPLPLIGGACILSILGAVLLLGRPQEFFASEESPEIEVVLDFPPGTAMEAAAAEGMDFSRILSGLKTVSSFFGKMGAEDEDIGRRVNPDYRREQLLFRCFVRNGIKNEISLKEIQDTLAQYSLPGIKVSAAYPRDRTGKLLGLSSFHTLAVKGIDPEDTRSRSESAILAVQDTAGSSLDNINIRPFGARPELRLVPDREAAAFLGISAARMAGAIYAVTEGIVTGILEKDGRPLDIRLTGDISDYSLAELETLPIAHNGNPVFLGSLGRIERRETEAALARQDRSDVLYLDLYPVPGKEKNLNALPGKLPRDYARADESVFVTYRSSLFITLVLVIILLYLTMAAQFESFLLPLILMLSIPFAMAGAGPMLLLTNTGLDSGSVLGLIVLFGLAVNNSIVLYEASEEKIKRGAAPELAVYRGALDRFRPVLITTLTTIFALCPLLFSSGTSQRSMAAAMAGGIGASAAFTVFAMPPVFVFLLRSGKRI